jgi:hypothetical protein
MKIEINYGWLAAQRGLPQHGARGGQVVCHWFLGEYRLAQFERADRDLRLQTGQRGDRDRLNVLVLNQCAPVAVSLRDVGGARKLRRPRRVAAGKRNHLAAWVGAERWQLHGASVVAADYSQTDHGLKTPLNKDFVMPGMDLSQIDMLRKGELTWVWATFA